MPSEHELLPAQGRCRRRRKIQAGAAGCRAVQCGSRRPLLTQAAGRRCRVMPVSQSDRLHACGRRRVLTRMYSPCGCRSVSPLAPVGNVPVFKRPIFGQACFAWRIVDDISVLVSPAPLRLPINKLAAELAVSPTVAGHRHPIRAARRHRSLSRTEMVLGTAYLCGNSPLPSSTAKLGSATSTTSSLYRSSFNSIMTVLSGLCTSQKTCFPCW